MTSELDEKLLFIKNKLKWQRCHILETGKRLKQEKILSRYTINVQWIFFNDKKCCHFTVYFNPNSAGGLIALKVFQTSISRGNERAKSRVGVIVGRLF